MFLLKSYEHEILRAQGRHESLTKQVQRMYAAHTVFDHRENHVELRRDNDGFTRAFISVTPRQLILSGAQFGSVVLRRMHSRATLLEEVASCLQYGYASMENLFHREMGLSLREWNPDEAVYDVEQHLQDLKEGGLLSKEMMVWAHDACQAAQRNDEAEYLRLWSDVTEEFHPNLGEVLSARAFHARAVMERAKTLLL